MLPCNGAEFYYSGGLWGNIGSYGETLVDFLFVKYVTIMDISSMFSIPVTIMGF